MVINEIIKKSNKHVDPIIIQDDDKIRRRRQLCLNITDAYYNIIIQLKEVYFIDMCLRDIMGTRFGVVFKCLSNIVNVKCFNVLFMILIANVCCIYTVDCKTLRVRRSEDINIYQYLSQYGYVQSDPFGAQNLIAEEEIIRATKQLQNFAGLPATGELDEATLKLLRTPRCGRPDIETDYGLSFEEPEVPGARRKRFTVSHRKWNHVNLTWSLSSSQWSRKLDRGHSRRVLNQAFSIWADDTPLTFREINSDQADIVISFATGKHNDNYAFDGPGSILAHAFYPTTGMGGDVHFDDDELWILNHNEAEHRGTSLLAVAAHEFGHSLGLSHSDNKESLMFPFYQTLGNDIRLQEDDRRGLEQIYGTVESRKWAQNPHYVKPTTRVTTTQRATTTRRPYRPHYPPTYDDKYHNKEKQHWKEHQNPHMPTTTNRVPYRPSYYPPQRTPTYTASSTNIPVPDKCNMTYDAITQIKGKIWVFKGIYYWHIGKNPGQGSGKGFRILNTWKGLPQNLKRIDTVYQRPDNKIAFFIGNQIYLFDENRLLQGYPKPLTYLGLPHDLKRIDAAFVWSYNRMTYFFSGNLYWKYDEKRGMVEYDYPRDISGTWRGFGQTVDTIFSYDETTYIFKGQGFWKFNDILMTVRKDKPLPTGVHWFKCDPRDVYTSSTYNRIANEPYPTESLVYYPNVAATYGYNYSMVLAIAMCINLLRILL